MMVSSSPTQLPDRIAEILARRIVLGELPAGSKIGQDHVAAEFGASHVPVREAFRRLEARGLLVSLPRRGVRVAPIDPAAVREVTEMRASLEALALGHAARAFSDEDAERAEHALEEAEASTDLIAWEEASRRFFRALVAPCGMPRLLGAIDDLHQTSARYMLAAWKGQDWPRSSEEFRALLEKMRARDAEGAAALLVSHILSTGRALAERF